MMMGGLGMGLGMLFVFGLPIILLLGGGVVVLSVLTKKPTPEPETRQNPRQILDIRLAKGEISSEDHDVLLKRLENERTS